MIKVIKVR